MVKTANQLICYQRVVIHSNMQHSCALCTGSTQARYDHLHGRSCSSEKHSVAYLQMEDNKVHAPFMHLHTAKTINQQVPERQCRSLHASNNLTSKSKQQLKRTIQFDICVHYCTKVHRHQAATSQVGLSTCTI